METGQVLIILAPWVLASAVVAWFARGRGHGFVGMFLVSVLFSPLIGGLIAFTRPGLGTTEKPPKSP